MPKAVVEVAEEHPAAAEEHPLVPEAEHAARPEAERSSARKAALVPQGLVHKEAQVSALEGSKHKETPKVAPVSKATPVAISRATLLD